jgi:hypothetical protein
MTPSERIVLVRVSDLPTPHVYGTMAAELLVVPFRYSTRGDLMPLHPFHLRRLAWELRLVRRAEDRERYAVSQRQARIDPNPHQIDAAIFALRRLREGGCILADEVGLGKTIEAGLVIAQSRAEGAQRVLLIVPKPLIGQWQNELAQLFDMVAQEEQTDFAPPGIYIVGREFAGGERGSTAIGLSPPFDLVVIDEAHELFAGLHKRYDRDGIEDPDSDQAVTAHRVRGLLHTAPVLLLTATPIQNSLAELWSLVQYVDRTGTLLGDLATFRSVFCADDDRALAPGQEHELGRRLSTVMQRTLRRQAQEFLDQPFTQRRCRLYEYTMSDEERALYDDVTEYLLEPDLYAFAGRQRRLLLIAFHRRMASSTAALASSLDRVAERLRDLLSGRSHETSLTDELLSDLEEDPTTEETQEVRRALDPVLARLELQRVEALAARAHALPSGAKARCLLDAVRVALELGRNGQGSGKVVVFTESVTTQDFLRKLLLSAGYEDGDITLFRGVNNSERTRAAHDRWLTEAGAHLEPRARPTRDVAVRLALVHEFKTRSRIFVSTEAGAKGLNLQFCDTLVNYDLPWNPQRIEQRIGRCHRYSQQRDVTVVNFLARDNDAHRLTFEILSQKLDLFGRVLDASDTVLHEPRETAPALVATAVSAEFERDLRNIYSRSRTLDEVTRELAVLREKVAARREAYEREYRRTSQIIEARFDEQIRAVFRKWREELPAGLAQLDRDIAELVDGHLACTGLAYQRHDIDARVTFEIRGEAPLPELCGDRRFATGDARELTDAQHLNLSHPLVQAAIESAAAACVDAVIFELAADADEDLAALAGKSGVLEIVRVEYAGFQPVQRLVVGAVAGGVALDPALSVRLFRLPVRDPLPEERALFDRPPARLLADALEEALFLDQSEIERGEQAHFEAALGQLERFAEDRVLVCRQRRAAIRRKLQSLRVRRDTTVGSEPRAKLETELRALEAEERELGLRILALQAREDPDYRRWHGHYRTLRHRAPTRTSLSEIAFQIRPRLTPC